MTPQTLKDHRDEPETRANTLTQDEIGDLIRLLDEKEDKVRYPAFLVLCARSKAHPDVYLYWDIFVQKMEDDNAYQRTIGLTLLGLNVRWDAEKRFEAVFKRFMSHCSDEKPITARLAIRSVCDWAPYAPVLLDETVRQLTNIDLTAVRETMRKLILTDIVDTLITLRAIEPSDAIDGYLMTALTGGLLDKKTVRRIQERLERGHDDAMSVGTGGNKKFS